jgi:hypothetical protein
MTAAAVKFIRSLHDHSIDMDKDHHGADVETVRLDNHTKIATITHKWENFV